MSNTILNQLGGLPVTRVDIYARALKELSTKGKYFKEAESAGLHNTTFTHEEISPLLDSWNQSSGSLHGRMATVGKLLREGKYSAALNKLRPSQTEAGQKLSNIYQLEESWFKLAKFIHNREKGMTPAQAAADAQKWLFNYSEVPKFIDWARQSPVGSPFITFTYKALPVIAESAVKYPWRIGSIVLLINELQKYSEEHLSLDDAEKKRLQAAQPEKMKGGVGAPNHVLLPYKDKNGDLQYYDLTYALPWGDLAETGLSGLPQVTPGLSSPVAPLFEVALNQTRLGKDVYNSTDTTGEKASKSAQHLYRQAVPSLAPGNYGWNRIEKGFKEDDEVRALLGAAFGQRINPVNIQQQERYRGIERNKQLEELRVEAGRVMRNPSLTEKQKQAQLLEINRKRQHLVRPQ